MSHIIGKQVPDLSIPATGNQDINLRDFKNKNIILYFYPKDDTPGCTQESNDFRELYSQIQKHNTEIFGVSRDTCASHEKFKTKYNYPFELLSDQQELLCSFFDVLKQKTSFGKTYKGIERSTFVISTSSLIQKEWRQVKVANHAQDVFNFIKNIC